MKDRLLKVQDAAERLGVSCGTLRNWLSERRLPFVKLGSATRIRESVIAGILEHGIQPLSEAPRKSGKRPSPHAPACEVRG